MITLISDKSDLRLDVFLSEILTEFSRSKNQQLIKDGFVKVNGSSLTNVKDYDNIITKGRTFVKSLSLKKRRSNYGTGNKGNNDR